MKTDYKKKFIKYLRNTNYTKSYMRVFRDFLSLSVIHGNSLTEEKRQEFTTPAFLFNYQKKLGNIPKQNLDKNILKEKENTLFSNSLEEDSDEEQDVNGLAFAKAVTTHLANNPLFAGKIKELKEKYNL